MADRFRFGEFEFDVDSGELRRHDGGATQRLPPQPARLLHLLLDRGGTIVTRDDIRTRLWPGTHVDFDTSLHFCVRQLRAALGDSATAPRYVQNVPRRGYRLVPEVARLDEVARPDDTVGAPASRASLTHWIGVLGLLVAAAIGALYLYGAHVPERSPRIRIAIMPFDASIAEWILADLSAKAGDSVGIVGPTTTAAYAGADANLRRLAADYGVDYIVNGRPLSGNGPPRVLAELIRVSDGMHVWVRPYEDLSDGRRVAREISEHVARALELR